MVEIDIQFNNRSDVAWEQGASFFNRDIYLEGAGNVHFSQHHIVPWNVLQNFWNHLVTNALFEQCSRIINELATRSPHYFIVFTDTRREELKRFAEAIKGCDYREKAGITELGGGHDFGPALNDAHSLYSYPAVDVFPGPNGDLRVDDAKEGFEAVAKYFIKQKGDWSRLNKALKGMNDGITESINARTKGRNVDKKIMERATDSYITLLRQNSPRTCVFKKENWEWINYKSHKITVVTDRNAWQNLPEGDRRYRVKPTP
ncbi:hypothetical protein ACIQFP_14920 [Nocardiopsis alba]|uniref:hypothetical protein n=1 Tax=Nocardiopsis alba TaxID=53437 RepID=UPI0038254129